MSTPHRPDHERDPQHHLPPAAEPQPKRAAAPHSDLGQERVEHVAAPVQPELSTPKAEYVANDDHLARVQSSDEFQELKRRFRNFAFPLSAAFLIWYFAFVLMSTYAVSFMRKEVFGHVTIGLVFGLLQFLTTFLITWLYIRHANKNLDPIASKLRAELEAQ